MMPATSRRNQAGFTIIELMISMTILAFISLGIYDITTSTFSRRESIEAEGDFYNSIRVALDVMSRDVSAMYSPIGDALPGSLGRAPQAQQPGAPGFAAGNANDQLQLGSPTPFWGEPINRDGVRPSRLQGEESKLSFVANSHMRIYRDSPESEFVKITYLLEEEKIRDPQTRGMALVKRENVDVFEREDDRNRGEDTEVRYALLSGIKNIKFEFLDGEKDTWLNRWDTASPDHKGVFPSVIKVTVEIFVPNTESTFTVTQQYRPELPI